MAQSFDNHMDIDRAMELLNAVVDHVAVAENTNTQIANLVNIGFTTEELVKYFSYSQSDIDDYLKNCDDDDDDGYDGDDDDDDDDDNDDDDDECTGDDA